MICCWVIKCSNGEFDVGRIRLVYEYTEHCFSDDSSAEEGCTHRERNAGTVLMYIWYYSVGIGTFDSCQWAMSSMGRSSVVCPEYGVTSWSHVIASSFSSAFPFYNHAPTLAYQTPSQHCMATACLLDHVAQGQLLFQTRHRSGGSFVCDSVCILPRTSVPEPR